MAKRFTVFNKCMEQSVEIVIDIVKCTCLLENIIIDKCNSSQVDFESSFSNESFINLSDDNIESIKVGNNIIGNKIQEQFVHFFLNS